MAIWRKGVGERGEVVGEETLHCSALCCGIEALFAHNDGGIVFVTRVVGLMTEKLTAGGWREFAELRTTWLRGNLLVYRLPRRHLRKRLIHLLVVMMQCALQPVLQL